jgi:hypothetical protein
MIQSTHTKAFFHALMPPPDWLSLRWTENVRWTATASIFTHSAATTRHMPSLTPSPRETGRGQLSHSLISSLLLLLVVVLTATTVCILFVSPVLLLCTEISSSGSQNSGHVWFIGTLEKNHMNRNFPLVGLFIYLIQRKGVSKKYMNFSFRFHYEK